MSHFCIENEDRLWFVPSRLVKSDVVMHSAKMVQSAYAFWCLVQGFRVHCQVLLVYRWNSVRRLCLTYFHLTCVLVCQAKRCFWFTRIPDQMQPRLLSRPRMRSIQRRKQQQDGAVLVWLQAALVLRRTAVGALTLTLTMLRNVHQRQQPERLQLLPAKKNQSVAERAVPSDHMTQPMMMSVTMTKAKLS